GVQPFIALGIGGEANSDQLARGIEQAAAASTLDGGTGNFDVGWSLITVNRGDLRIDRRGIGPAVTANGGDRRARLERRIGGGDRNGLHRPLRAHDDEGDVAFQIVVEYLTGDRLVGLSASGGGLKERDRDCSLAG